MAGITESLVATGVSKAVTQKSKRQYALECFKCCLSMTPISKAHGVI